MISGYHAIKGIDEDAHGLDHLNLSWRGAYYEHGITYRYVMLEGLEAIRAHMVAMQNPIVDPQNVILLELDGGGVAVGTSNTPHMQQDSDDRRVTGQKHPTKSPVGKPEQPKPKEKRVLVDEQ